MDMFLKCFPILKSEFLFPQKYLSTLKDYTYLWWKDVLMLMKIDLNYCDISVYWDNPRFDIGARTLVETSALETSDSRILLEPASFQYIYLQETSMHNYRIQ